MSTQVVRICTGCGTPKEETEFYRSKGRLQPACKRCCIAREQERYRANPEAGKLRARKAYWANPDANRATSRAWRAKNPERSKELVRAGYDRNRARSFERSAAWAAANPEKQRAITRKMNFNRRARLMGCPGDGVTAEELGALREQFCGLCAYCLKPGDTVDHLVALADGGTNDATNIVLACKSCNSGKRHRSLLGFVMAKRRKSPVAIFAPLQPALAAGVHVGYGE